MDTFKIRTYGRTELAQLYCPTMNPRAAFRKLMQWIDLSISWTLCISRKGELKTLGGMNEERASPPVLSL